MTGRKIDLKNTVPFLEMGEVESFGFGDWGLHDIHQETNNDRALESFKGENVDPCTDKPYCFAPGPNRAYIAQFVPHYRNGGQDRSYTYRIISAYKPFIDHFIKYSAFPRNLVILIISGDSFAGAVYKEGKIAEKKEIHSLKLATSSKSEKDGFRQNVKSLLETWKDHIESSNYVLIRCTYEDKQYFFAGKGNSICRHIPFETGKPTIKEVERVFDRLLRLLIHDTNENTLKELRKEKRNLPSINDFEEEPEFSGNAIGNERKRWCWMNSSIAERLVDYVENDHGNGLYEEVQAHPHKSKLLDYLNSGHIMFNNGTFLHFAVQKDASSIVDKLIELGCDPTAKDDKNKVPFDYYVKEDVKELYIEFKPKNSYFYNKNK